MARTIAPRSVDVPDAKLIKTTPVDFSQFEKTGDNLIEASNTNFKLYTDVAWKKASNEAYNKFQDNPIALGQALGKIQADILPNIPESMKKSMQAQMYLDNIGMIQKAENKRIELQNAEIKENANSAIQLTSQQIGDAYANLLRNNTLPADQRISAVSGRFQAQEQYLKELAETRDSFGKHIYTKEQREKLVSNGDQKLEAAKAFFDEKIMNDNEDLQESKDYYTKFILAPEEFMEKNFMDRKTYESFKTYAEGRLKASGADIKNARFNRTIKDALILQVENLPNKLERLKEEGLLDKSIIRQMEENTVKFNKLDPAKEAAPFALIDALDIVYQWRNIPDATTEAERTDVLRQGTYAQSALLNYAETYGIDLDDIKTLQLAIVDKEQHQAYDEFIQKIAESKNALKSTIDDFDGKLEWFRKNPDRTKLTSMSDLDMAKMIKFQKATREAMNDAHIALAQNDQEGFRQAERTLVEKAVKAQYIDKLSDTDWEEWNKNPEKIFQVNGQFFKIRGIDYDNNDITIEELS